MPSCVQKAPGGIMTNDISFDSFSSFLLNRGKLLSRWQKSTSLSWDPFWSVWTNNYQMFLHEQAILMKTLNQCPLRFSIWHFNVLSLSSPVYISWYGPPSIVHCRQNVNKDTRNWKGSHACSESSRRRYIHICKPFSLVASQLSS